MTPITISRIITIWMTSITILLSCMLSSTHNDEEKMYRFGPHDDLIILGIYIDTYNKYFLLISYVLLNTIVRNINHNVIGPWIILNIQDDTRKLDGTLKAKKRGFMYDLDNVDNIDECGASRSHAHCVERGVGERLNSVDSAEHYVVCGALSKEYMKTDADDNGENASVLVDAEKITRLTAYEISTCSTIFVWFDWFIYIHLLLAQIDIVIIEMGTDVLTNAILVRWYLKKKEAE